MARSYGLGFRAGSLRFRAESCQFKVEGWGSEAKAWVFKIGRSLVTSITRYEYLRGKYSASANDPQGYMRIVRGLRLSPMFGNSLVGIS